MELLQDIWQGNGIKLLMALREKGKPVHQPVRSAQEAEKAAQFLSRKGYDVYWAISEFTSDTRKQAHVQSVAALWVDLDVGQGKAYKTQAEALRALNGWIQKHNFPKPTHIVSSGYGLHIYWALDQGYSPGDWLPVAQKFKQALRVGGLDFDAGCTSDSARVLRVPGTYNYKHGHDNAPLVKTLHRSETKYSLQALADKLPAVGPQAISRGATPQIPKEWDVPIDFPPADAHKIASKCQQMQYFKEKGGAVREPFWRAGLSVLYRCENGEFFIHEWSRGDPRYDPQQTQDKAQRTAGPATCLHFNEVNPDGCTGCPHQVTSPIQLGTKIEPAPPPSQEETWKINKINGFTVTDQGIWHQAPPVPGDPEPVPTQVTDVPLWIKEVREKGRMEHERGQSSLEIRWKDLQGKSKTGVAFQSDIYDTKAFKTWLADHNIISAVREVRLLVSYITQYTAKLMRKEGSKTYHDKLGWVEDGFVLGNKKVTEQGVKTALVQSSNPISKLQPKDGLKQWKQAADILKQRKYRKHAAAVLFGFASPLYALADVQSAVISLAGVSGAGKTLAAQFAVSIFGDPEFLGQSANSTMKSIEQQLSCNHHVPYLLDEISVLKTHVLSDLIYMAANGEGRASLTRNRETREAGSWKLTPFLTSNNPVLEQAVSQITEAHRRRVLELYFEDAFPQADAAPIYEAIKKSAGAAGVVFLQELIKYRDKIPQMMELAKKIIKQHIEIPEAHRFSLWSLSAALIAGLIAKKTGLIKYDLLKVLKAAVEDVNVAIKETRTPQEIAEDTVKEFLARNSQRICHWGKGHKDVGEPVENPVARVMKNGWVAVHASELNRAWYDNRVSPKNIRSWLDQVTDPSTTVRLAPGTPPVKVYKFNETFIDLSEIKEP